MLQHKMRKPNTAQHTNSSERDLELALRVFFHNEANINFIWSLE